MQFCCICLYLRNDFQKAWLKVRPRRHDRINTLRNSLRYSTHFTHLFAPGRNGLFGCAAI